MIMKKTDSYATENYITISNEYYEIYTKECLKGYVNRAMNYSTSRMKKYLNFFKEHSYGKKIKVSYFDNRDDFFDRIKLLNPKATPPKWATGCFCGGEIQILLYPSMEARFLTLAHETFHLFFNKFVYDKEKFNRIVWLDESLAAAFSGQTEKTIETGRFLEILKRLLELKTFPNINDLKFQNNNIKTKDYDAYDFFFVIGAYLRETMDDSELLRFIRDKEIVLESSNFILQKSLEFYKNKYNF